MQIEMCYTCETKYTPCTPKTNTMAAVGSISIEEMGTKFQRLSTKTRMKNNSLLLFKVVITC